MKNLVSLIWGFTVCYSCFISFSAHEIIYLLYMFSPALTDMFHSVQKQEIVLLDLLRHEQCFYRFLSDRA